MSELQKQVTHVVDRTHDLLGGSMAVFDGTSPREKFMIELPVGLTYLATYLSLRQSNQVDLVESWEFYERAINGQDKTVSNNLKRRMRCYVTNHVENFLHDELHELSTTEDR